MTPSLLLFSLLTIPFAAAILIVMSDPRPNQREGVTLVAAVALCLCSLALVPHVLAGESVSLVLAEPVAGLPLALSAEPLGMTFGLVASFLWIVNSIYSIGYMRGNGEAHQTRFYVCFAIALGSTMGVAFASNLFTLFVFYELLTLSTYPLVTHKEDDDAKRSGRLYLGMLLGTSMLLLLPAIAATWAVAGTVEFTPGGILGGKVSDPVMGLLLAMYVFGIGKAAVMPMHSWLPAAMVAPTPVSALLHAVAVVKAGVFSVLKVIVYVFGPETLLASGVNQWLIYVAGATVIVASLVAMTKDNLKARLAYSTVSQLSYIVVGALLATRYGIIGGGLQIAMHAMGKITLFFCAGAIYTAAHKTEISELGGMGRVMPFTFVAFFIGALSIIGLPPLGGVWSKWYLVIGALDAGQTVVVAALLISSLLNIAYLLPIPIKAFFGTPAPGAGGHGDAPSAHPPGEAQHPEIHEAPIPCLIAIGVTALGSVLLFFFYGPILDLLKQIPIE